MRFSLRSLFIVTVVAGVVLGVGRMLVLAAISVADQDLGLLWWIGGFAAFAAIVGMLYVFANR